MGSSNMMAIASVILGCLLPLASVASQSDSNNPTSSNLLSGELPKYFCSKEDWETVLYKKSDNPHRHIPVEPLTQRKEYIFRQMAAKRYFPVYSYERHVNGDKVSHLFQIDESNPPDESNPSTWLRCTEPEKVVELTDEVLDNYGCTTDLTRQYPLLNAEPPRPSLRTPTVDEDCLFTQLADQEFPMSSWPDWIEQFYKKASEEFLPANPNVESRRGDL